MEIQEQIWNLKNKIHEIQLTISTDNSCTTKDYCILYQEMRNLEKELKTLLEK